MLQDISNYILINLVISLCIFLLMVKNISEIIFTILFSLLFFTVSVVCFKGMFMNYKVVGESEETYKNINPGYRNDNYILSLCVFSFILISFFYLFWEDIEKNNSIKYTLTGVFGSFYILLYLYFKLYI